MAKQNSSSNVGRTILGVVAAIIFIAAALCAQYVLNIDLDVFEEDATPAGTAVVTTTPGSVEATQPGGTPVASGEITLTAIPGGYDGGWFQIYFTEPINSTDESLFVNAPLENALVAAIDGAQQTINAALFELNSAPVTNALIAAHDRGVVVRIVTDGEHGLESPDSTMGDLELAGIEVKSDADRSAFMHNKFFVFDGQLVWTGSTNITHNGIYNNNNNALLIRSRQLAENYETEFEELFGEFFGPTSEDVVPNPVFTFNGVQIETFFESEGRAPERLAVLFESAHSVRFMAFSFTGSLEWRDLSGVDHSVLEYLIERALNENMALQGIVETSQRRFLSDAFCAQLDIRQDGNPDILHHKVFIIDEDIVAIGSFNFSRNAASSNDENMLIIHSEPIARVYLEEFNERWAESVEMPADAFTCE